MKKIETLTVCDSYNNIMIIIMNSKYLTISVSCINTNKIVHKKVPIQLIEKMRQCNKHDLVVHVNKWDNQCYVVIVGTRSILICSDDIDGSGKFKKYIFNSPKKM